MRPHAILDAEDSPEAEDDAITRLLSILPRLRRNPVQIQWDTRVFDISSTDVPLYISFPDALEIVGA